MHFWYPYTYNTANNTAISGVNTEVLYWFKHQPAKKKLHILYVIYYVYVQCISISKLAINIGVHSNKLTGRSDATNLLIPEWAKQKLIDASLNW